ncbi:MAG: type 1 glutamine amidotransferase [Calditrichaeota bacterium]|nr:type 1 glutamine amidotransferase [Calditrichota bacterium]
MKLNGKRVGILVEKLYEDLELWYPKIRLEEEGAEVKLIGMETTTYPSKHGYPAKADLTVYDAELQEWDGLIIPGGYAPDHLRRYTEMIRFVRDQHQKGALIATICHGPWVLISAEIVAGKKMTCFFAIKDDLINAGAQYVDEPVVVDGNLISSRHPHDLPYFGRAIIDYLARK